MKTIGGYPFPETKEEAETWLPAIHRVWLSRRVVAVAKTRIEGKWAAYIDDVADARNVDEVLDRGTKLPQRIAEAVFPYFAEIPYAP